MSESLSPFADISSVRRFDLTARSSARYPSTTNSSISNTMEDGASSRRHSVGLLDYPMRMTSAGTTTTTERKTSPRPNQQQQEEDEEHLHEDEEEDGAIVTDGLELRTAAVESAADALLQRLRLRARVGKPSNEQTTTVADDDEHGGASHITPIDNQETTHQQRYSMPPAASPQPQGLTAQVLSTQQSSAAAVLRRPHQGPHHQVRVTSGLPTITTMTPSSSSSSSTEWRAALMARASSHRTPGEQLDLPDFADDASSDMSGTYHEQMVDDDDEDDDGAISDGELMLSQQTLDGEQFGQSTDDHNGHADLDEDDEGDDDEDEGEFDEEGTTSDLERDEAAAMALSNRDVNVSKAIALKNAMVRNLTRLAFHEDLARAALDAGVQEIEQYDSDCELAYVDIFLTLVKLVCDAHERLTPPPLSSLSLEITRLNDSDSGSPRVEQFKWPVFDMAQFEFGNARAGTCFDSVCVLINLPKVSMDRTEELMEVLSSCLFVMIGDPIQVLIPSVSATGRTKGHAFLEFDDPEMARACAAAVDGLTWGRGPYGRIRAKMFRQYQVKAPAPTLTAAAAVPPPLPGHHQHTYGFAFQEEEEEDELSSFRGRRRPHPPHARGGGGSNGLHRSLPPRYDENFQMTEPLGLSRDDLNTSEISSSNASWDNSSRASVGGLDDSSGRRQRALFRHQQLQDGPGPPVALHHSMSSLDEEMAMFRRSHGDDGDGMMRLGELRLSSDDDDHDHDEDDGGESSATESDLDLEANLLTHPTPPSGAAIARARRSQSLRQTLPPLPVDPQMAATLRFRSSHVTPANSSSNITTAGVDIEGPWKAYCEELITRNREMQEQVTYARRRIAALGHNNQKLHLLIDRMERDRDGLLFENDLLQTQLHGYEDHERQQETLMKELAALRRRMRRRDQRIERGLDDILHFGGGDAGGAGAGGTAGDGSLLYGGGARAVAVDLEGGVMRLDELEEQLVQNIVSSRRLDDLKEWEQMLESSLVRVRSIKEEIAMELQKQVTAAQQAAAAGENNSNGIHDHKLCVVCLSNEKSILCLPCRHLCLCQVCSQHQELDKCPICRLAVENMLLVYA